MKYNLPTMQDVDMRNRRVVIREDYNVPVQDGRITDTHRIDATIPTLSYCLEQQAAVILLSHMGRPLPGEPNERYSLAPVAEYLASQLDAPVRFAKDWLNGVDIEPGEVVLCENVRFLHGEKRNDPSLARSMASLGDIFVMDAFATAHRDHASTAGISHYIEQACAGPLLIKELNDLDNIRERGRPPRLAIVGGSKVSTKLNLLHALIEQVDILITGGGIANTLLKASGSEIASSLHEPSLLDDAREILTRAERNNVHVPLPIDVIVAKELTPKAQGTLKKLDDLEPDDKIFDIGPETIACYESLIRDAGTIIWNGPVGVFEIEAFSNGTHRVGEAIAKAEGLSMAGGGDTLAAIKCYDLASNIDMLSTGGGAFLAYIQGEPLPALEALKV